MTDKKVYAEDVNYWKSGKTSPDTWILNTKKLIASVNGKVRGFAFGEMDGKSALVLMFEIGDDKFKLTWPVLESRTGDTVSANRQAATMLYHDVKARVVAVKVLGPRVAFIPWLLLPTGQTVAETSAVDLVKQLPNLLPMGERL